MRADERPGITLCWPGGKVAPVVRFERTRRDRPGDTRDCTPTSPPPLERLHWSRSPFGPDRSPDRGRPGGGIPLVSHPALRHDLRNPLRIPGVQIPPTFEDFQHIFLIGQSDQCSPLRAELCDVVRRVESFLLGRGPKEIVANAIPAQGGIWVSSSSSGGPPLERVVIGGRVAQGRAGGNALFGVDRGYFEPFRAASEGRG